MNGTEFFDAVRPVADAVLYEGYVLYPYRASSAKNRSRWQFGVLMPPAYVQAEPSERASCRTEIVFEASATAVLHVEVRYLHVAHRSGGDRPEWDETIERQIDLSLPLADLRSARHRHTFEIAGDTDVDGDVRRAIADLAGAVTVGVEQVPGPFGALRLTVEIENTTVVEPGDRDVTLRHALVAAHTLCALEGGRFLSMTEPPEWAAPAVAACANAGTWPVLAGSKSVVLSSPIILGDHPQIAPESPGDLYDSTEIDEILTLRTMALTDEEKAEARVTDPRSAAVLDRVDGLPPEHLERLHGALRYLRQVTEGPATLTTPSDASPIEGDATATMTPGTPWWDPGADASVSPESDSILIAGEHVSRGSRVRLHPGARRTDAQDFFLRGRTATVEAVFFDVDGAEHLGVTPDDDPELAEVARWHGRFLYFAPDEVEPVPNGPSEPAR